MTLGGAASSLATPAHCAGTPSPPSHDLWLNQVSTKPGWLRDTRRDHVDAVHP